MSDLQKALRLILHAADWAELLPDSDYGADLLNDGLLIVGTIGYELTDTGEQLVREATGATS